jgi:hypothetical protein
MYYEEVFRELNEKGVKYLVVGGMAVVLHGIVRLTADLDIIIDLGRENALKLVSAMDKLGYKPRVPVPAGDFADVEKRESWIKEKNMEVFSFFDPKNSLHLVDVLIKEPIDFEEAYKKRSMVEAAGVKIPVVSIRDLIRLKNILMREKDLLDIAALKKLEGINHGD